MIKLNDTKQNITLKAIGKDVDVNSLVIREHGKTTLISEDKTIYLYLEKKLDHYELYDLMKKFASCNKYSLNIDIESFKPNTTEDTDIITAIGEAVLYSTNEGYTLKTSKQEKPELVYNLLSSCSCASEKVSKLQIKMEYVNLARRFQDAPPNKMYPEIFANEIKEIVKEYPEIKITILDKKDIEKEDMGLLLAVNAGSNYEPRVVVLEYNTDPEAEKVGLIGKGITFDSGGYNLKPSAALKNMKFDMSGAAIVSSTVIALAKAKAKANVVAVSCLTENKIGSTATLTESVIKSKNGKTVQIDNTDAEGRLVLADGMTYAIRNKNVDKLIDVSTLTGAILITLGKYMTGVFSHNDEFYKEFESAAKRAHEEIWRLPIHRYNLAPYKNAPIADLNNLGTMPSGPGHGSSSGAAAFLNEFAEDKPYIHLDIAGTADENNRGTGVMVKTLFELLNKN